MKNRCLPGEKGTEAGSEDEAYLPSVNICPVSSEEGRVRGRDPGKSDYCWDVRDFVKPC